MGERGRCGCNVPVCLYLFVCKKKPGSSKLIRLDHVRVVRLNNLHLLEEKQAIQAD